MVSFAKPTFRILITVFCVLGTVSLLTVLLWWRLRLGIVRYFDMDEFAYLNWAYHMFSGSAPYRDFMMIATPLFVSLLAPLFRFWSGIDTAVAGRVVAFVIFVSLTVGVWLHFALVRKSWLGVAAAVILTILPMPADKMLEIRPDNLAIAVFWAGLVCYACYREKPKLFWIFCTGFVWSTSFFVLQKTAFLIGWAVGVVILDFLLARKPRHVLTFLIGLSLPVMIFVLWAISCGCLDQAIYSVGTLPIETAGISKYNPIGYDFYFQPNITYYGEWGRSLGWLTNHTLWAVAFLVAALRVCIALIRHRRGEISQEILIAGLLFLPAYSYVKLIPLRHSQYLIPIAPLIAWYGADALHGIWRFFRKKPAGMIVFAFLYGCAGWFSYRVFFRVNDVKLQWVNATNLAKMQAIYNAIPRTEYILDLEGRTIYYPYPYYVCCLSFGQFGGDLSRPLPSLSQSLERTKTKYIYQAEIPRVGSLSGEDQQYINAHYVPFGDNTEMLVRKE